MKFRIVHKTDYLYSGLVSLCQNEARLTPRQLEKQAVASSGIAVDTAPTSFRERKDFFGNAVFYFSLEYPHENLSVTATSEVAVDAAKSILPDFDQSLPWEDARAQLRTAIDPLSLCARQFVMESPMAAAWDLTQRIHGEFDFVSGFTTIATPLSEVLAHRKGVCQDFAHLAIGCLRSMGLSARYMSGYIETLPPPGQEKLAGADASHAWFSVFAPGIGWVDFDPTNGLIPGEQHITVAWGRDYADVTPLKGVIINGGGTHQLAVSVDVRRLAAP